MTHTVRFVLCETSHPGNIGAAARAIKTMGFSDLVLVNPGITRASRPRRALPVPPMCLQKPGSWRVWMRRLQIVDWW